MCRLVVELHAKYCKYYQLGLEKNTLLLKVSVGKFSAVLLSILVFLVTILSVCSCNVVNEVFMMVY